jgi:NAD(P)-dependent dehydrogenase (short-subunit alcohol dehydrogenase family)
MNLDLSGKTALVTGSTSGIGFATAKGLHEAGARIIINGRGQERVDATIERVGGGDRVVGVAADIGTAEGCQALVDAEPNVDILVNNAAIFNPEPIFEIPDSEWERFLTVNLLSGVRLSRAYGPGMVERNWGRIVFVSSESAVHIPTEMVHYGVTKLAQIGLSRGLAESVAGTGVTVNSVLPGLTRSEGLVQFLEDMPEVESVEAGEEMLVNDARPTQLLRRMGSPDEVANMIVYLCSPAASATTGAPIRVDGGTVRAAV